MVGESIDARPALRADGRDVWFRREARSGGKSIDPRGREQPHLDLGCRRRRNRPGNAQAKRAAGVTTTLESVDECGPPPTE
jgi:hypothetical protein